MANARRDSDKKQLPSFHAGADAGEEQQARREEKQPKGCGRDRGRDDLDPPPRREAAKVRQGSASGSAREAVQGWTQPPRLAQRRARSPPSDDILRFDDGREESLAALGEVGGP